MNIIYIENIFFVIIYNSTNSTNSKMDIPNLVLEKMKRVENIQISGTEKKIIVMDELKKIFYENSKINFDDLISDLIELLINVTKKKVKLGLNKKSNLITRCVVH